MKYLHLPFKLLRRYWNELLRVLTFIMAVIILIFGSVAYSRSQQTSANQLQQIKTLASQNKQLNLYNEQILQQLKTIVTNLNNNSNTQIGQINCVLTFFSQPPSTRTNSSIANSPNPCIIKTSMSSSGGATGSTKSG